MDDQSASYSDECERHYDITKHISDQENEKTEDQDTATHFLPSADEDYGNYLNKLFQVTNENKKLKLLVEQLKNDLSKAEASSSGDIHAIQSETFEKTIQQQKIEIERLNGMLTQQNELSENKTQQLKEEYLLKIERLSKQYEQASKEREAMVMKYAVSENSAINLQRQIKQLEVKMKDHLKEHENTEGRLKTVIGEKAKLAQLLDNKNSEILVLDREIQKKKDELHAQASNLKFFQNKLKLELESHKETQSKLEKMAQKVREAKEETEQVRSDGLVMLRRYETDGRKVLELADSEEVTNLQIELESWRHKYEDLSKEQNQLSKKLQSYEAERLEYQETFLKLKQCMNGLQQSSIELQSTREDLESTKLLLSSKEHSLLESQSEVERLKQSAVDLDQEMVKCRDREAELLSFTQMLTEKNVCIQSELTSLETRVQLQDTDLNAAKREVVNLMNELATLKDELSNERYQRSEEKELLTRHLNERTETAQRLSQQLEDQIGENQLLKKKHLASVKELNRELQAFRRRAEAQETVSLGPGSRTSSNTSLNNMETSTSPSPSVSIEPDRQLLIEKIVKVQRSNAKKQEKLEFLEEHARQLIVELQRKSRIIQSLVMKQQPGALVSETMDNNKIALAKHGGIMASVYSSKPSDDTMTLELSLEINRKLQTVLEDTLLKNITLKENMETLGNEIARLASAKSS